MQHWGTDKTGKFDEFAGRTYNLMKNQVSKMSLRIFGFLIGILYLMLGCQSTLNSEKQAIIDSISVRWVPDNREGICNVKVRNGKDGSLILKGETTLSQAKQEIITKFKNFGIILIDSILLLPDTVRNDKYKGLVSLSVINLRKEPDHRSELVSQAILGTPVLILKNENSWLLIQTPDKYIAWTENTSIKLMRSAEMESWKKEDRVIYLENTGWIYASPDESAIVCDLVAGCILTKVGEKHGYTRIVLPDGREGFLKNKTLMSFNSWKTSVKCTEENICRVASTYLGLPYLWGGSSPKAVDCSGFVKSVYFMNGIILSRDASLQAEHGQGIDISNGYDHLKRGDLLFFGSKENSILHVTHVAIYKGDTEYINSSGRVMINSLDSARENFSSYRENSLLAARRIIGIDNDKGIVPVIKHAWY
jgi:gamma-D-glutamyl-L-lysine dipeptidyl-peptidase